MRQRISQVRTSTNPSKYSAKGVTTRSPTKENGNCYDEWAGTMARKSKSDETDIEYRKVGECTVDYCEGVYHRECTGETWYVITPEEAEFRIGRWCKLCGNRIKIIDFAAS